MVQTPLSKNDSRGKFVLALRYLGGGHCPIRMQYMVAYQAFTSKVLQNREKTTKPIRGLASLPCKERLKAFEDKDE